jgi:phenylalanyl-tRNA synthetase alpha chain
MGLDKFLVAGDVYRRDEIDSTHYPVFHQMEGVALFREDELERGRGVCLFEDNVPSGGDDPEDRQAVHSVEAVELASQNLKGTLDGLVKHLFGEKTETRWLPCYFPFTHPSFELEIKFNGEWLEVLGSGVMRQQILNAGGVEDKIGWAFGLGLDRLAMLLFQIPDIRLLWTDDPRFLRQFEQVGLDPSTNITFNPYSKFPACYKDIAFWLKDDSFVENDFYELVRTVGGDLVEQVEKIDSFVHPKSQRTSLCYRVMYRSMDRSVTNEEVNALQEQIREAVSGLAVELR